MNTLKKPALLFCMLLSLMLFPIAVSAAEPVEAKNYNLMINGSNIVFDSETPPLISNGRTLLPLRFLFDIINVDKIGTVEWDETIGQITMAHGDTIVKLWIGSEKAEVNGSELIIDGTTPIIFNKRTYVPLRFVADAFDMTVNWDAPSSTAFAMDNETLDKIFSLWKGASEISEDMPKTTYDLVMDMSMTIASGGTSESMDVKMNGKIEQDFANKYQHLIMNSTVGGLDVTVESYDDGESMYLIANDQVMKMDSAFSIADGLLSQYDLTAGLDISKEYYTSFKIFEEGENYIITGDMYLPEELFDDVLSKLNGMGGIETPLMDMSMKLDS